MSTEGAPPKPGRTSRYPGPRPPLPARKRFEWTNGDSGDFREGPLVAIVWILAVVLCGFLLLRRADRFEVWAVAQPLQYQVSAQTPGNVTSVAVTIYQAVEPGQVLVRLDGAPVEARIQTARVELERLLAEVRSGAAGLTFQQAGAASDRRRFEGDEEQLWLSVLSLKVELEGDAIELQRLNQKVQRSEALAREGILPASELENLVLERNRVARRIEENKTLKSETEGEHEKAKRRRESFERRFPISTQANSVQEPLRATIKVQEQRIAEIEVERAGLEIRSPVAGQVSQILARSGKWVAPGEILASVTERTASEILAYIPETFPEPVDQYTRLLVARSTRGTPVTEYTVSRVGPAIELLPQRLWRLPAIPEYGRPVVISGVSALKLTPGELVTVRPKAGARPQ